MVTASAPLFDESQFRKDAWHLMAILHARDAHENHFASRRGIWFLVDLGVLCIYNNNPWADDPTRRDQETAEFRRRMAAAGIEELAYATYPPEGEEDAGYTYALLLKADQSEEQFIKEAMEEAVKAFWK